MDRIKLFPIRRYTSLEEMKADEYRYWQERPPHERLTATAEISGSLYAVKDGRADVPGLRGPLIRFER